MSIREYLDGKELPKSIGRCADLYAEVRELRLAMEKEVEPVQKLESTVREFIIANVPEGETGASGLKYRAQITKNTVAKVSDWDQLWAYIFKTKRTDLLQKRVGEKAVADMWEEGETVPGVEKMHLPSVSITKV